MDEKFTILVLWDLGAILFALGMWLILTPASEVMVWERRAGYWIYQNELRASGSKELAMEKAAKFYFWFGMFTAVTSGFLVAVLTAAIVWEFFR